LFVATDLSTGGGVNKVIRDLAVLLSEQLGATVTVVNARSDRPPSYAFPREVRLEQNRRQSRLAYFSFLWRLRGKRSQFVVGSWTQDNILIALAFLFSGSKVILIEHTSWTFHGRFVRLLRRAIYPLAWKVIVLNPAELRHYRRYLRNVRLLPNPVPAIEAAARGSREKLILAVGHLERRKNFADAVRAMAESGLEDEGWSLVIVGDGPERAMLEQLSRELGLSRTSIHPPTRELGSWYARASLTLVTARIEVFSLVLAEAMLAGVVPIAYATDGPSFILEDFPEHLVPIGDVRGLSERLGRFAAAANLDPLRAELCKSVESRFSPDVMAGRWRALLAEACDRWQIE
jgi:glycosyltransferase involved in cell wall biosynthesis